MSKQGKATPGPWYLDDQDPDDKYRYVMADEAPDADWAICRVTLISDRTAGEANARLIAAGPELLAACKTINEWIDGTGTFMLSGDHVNLQKLRAAIAKAEGRQ